MQIGNVFLKLAQIGNNVPLKGVTPAECVILAHPEHGHHLNAGGFPLSKLEITGTAMKPVFDEENQVWTESKKEERSNKDEIIRLRRKFPKKVVEAIFPGAAPQLPQTFDEACTWQGDDAKVANPSKKEDVTKKEEPKK